MIYTVLITEDDYGTKRIVQEHEIKNGLIYVQHYDEYSNPYNVPVEVKIIGRYLISIMTEFILRKDDHAVCTDGGFGQINHLAYFYSVIIRSDPNSSSKMYSLDVSFKDSGIRSTHFDMYAYHTNDPFTYHTSQIEYECFCSLDLQKILLND